jgi:hypothetical protein
VGRDALAGVNVYADAKVCFEFPSYMDFKAGKMQEFFQRYKAAGKECKFKSSQYQFIP